MNDEYRAVDFESLEPPLEAAVKAALEEPIPEDAIDRVKARAKLLAATAVLPSPMHGSRPKFLARSLTHWRWIMRHPISGVAAAVIFVVASAGVALWFHSSGATLAVADFMQPLLQAKTVKYKTIIEMKGPSPMTIRSEDMVLDATRLRREIGTSNGPKTVAITDWGRGKSLTLYPAEEQATILNYSNTQNYRNDPNLWFRLLQTARDNKNKKFPSVPLGEKEIDGRRVVGFRISSDRDPPMDLWGDPKTGMPVRVEMTTGMDGNIKVTLSDFVFNAPMDESLFSVEPPPGYTVRTEKADESPDRERDLLEMFREYTKLTGGVFPESLDMQTASWVYWKKFNIQAMWDNMAGAPPLWNNVPTNSLTEDANEAERRKFEGQISTIMDKMHDEIIAGKVSKEQALKLAEQMTKIIMPITSRRLWENLAPASWRADETRRRKFEEQMLKLASGTAEEKRRAQQEISKLITAKLWEEQAPADWKADEGKRCKFEELMLKHLEKATGKPAEVQKFKDELRQALGDRMVKSMEAWDAKMTKTGKAQEAKMRKTAESQKAASAKFMEAQGQIQRGIHFANHLPPSAEARYVGKGVRLGAADTPVFWYRPTTAKKYRVIYADLSVREADAPPHVPKARPVPNAASLKK
jgi:hypothetical protein